MLKTLPNSTTGTMQEQHTLDIPACCPVSKNPRPGSKIVIRYRPMGKSLEVASLFAYIHSFKGGMRDESGQLVVRDMEGMILRIAQDCRDVLGVPVEVEAQLQIVPRQEVVMKIQKELDHV